LDDLNIFFSAWVLVISISVFSIAWLKYPGKSQDRIRTYNLRKTCDVVLICTTFFMFMYFGNRQVTPFSSSVFSASAINSFSLPKDSTKAYKSLEDFRKSLKDENGKPKIKRKKKIIETTDQSN
jgi:hypothetical protein